LSVTTVHSNRLTVATGATVLLFVFVRSKSRRGSSGIYEKDEKLSEKERELMEKDAEVSALSLFVSLSIVRLA